MTAHVASIPGKFRLTERSVRVLRCLASYQRVHGYPPSYREIAKTLAFSSRHAALWHVRKLMLFGLVERDCKQRSRGTRITDAGKRLLADEASHNPDTEIDEGFRCEVCQAHTFAPHPRWLCRTLLAIE